MITVKATILTCNEKLVSLQNLSQPLLKQCLKHMIIIIIFSGLLADHKGEAVESKANITNAIALAR